MNNFDLKNCAKSIQTKIGSLAKIIAQIWVIKLLKFGLENCAILGEKNLCKYNFLYTIAKKIIACPNKENFSMYPN